MPQDLTILKRDCISRQGKKRSRDISMLELSLCLLLHIATKGDLLHPFSQDVI